MEKINFPTEKEFVEKIAEKALDEFLYKGKTLREWIKIFVKQEPCEDAVSRKDVEEMIFRMGSVEELEIDFAKLLLMSRELNKLPSIKQEPKIGHWIKIGDRGLGWSDTVICKCSECEYQKEFRGKFDGHNLIVDTERADNYCSNCGAKMESEK